VDPRVEVALVPVTANRNLDLLFVIDDSTNLLDTQLAVVHAFSSLEQQIVASGRPSLHLGVVSSDVGTLGAFDTQPGLPIGEGPGSCSSDGRAGILTTSSQVMGRYIIDDPAAGITNYTGSLDDAFTSIGILGSSGCGFEQHLHAMKRALDNNVENAGFLRADAQLGVIVFTDEDDCSFAHSSFVSIDTSAFGPMSFRCPRFGITCDDGGATPDQMALVGPKWGCHANESSDSVMHPSEYVAYLKGLKADPRDVMFGTLAGDPLIEVEARTPPGGGTPIPALAVVCDALDWIEPSVRLAQLPAQFRHGSFESVCTTDMHPAMTNLGRQLRNLIGDSCLARDIALPADCRVFDETLTTTRELSRCTETIATDCYRLVEDPVCIAGQHLRVDVTRSAPALPGTMVSVRCVTL